MDTPENEAATAADVTPAADLLGQAAPLPKGTPGLGHATPVPDQAAPLPGGEHPKDRKGTVWDPVIHETPPRLNAERTWAKLRGNAARKAQGMAPTGKVGAFQARPQPAADAPTAPPAQAAPPSIASGGGADAGADAVHDGEVMPGARSLADYETTACSLTDGQFGLASLVIGPAWEPEKRERDQWVKAYQRLLHHYQAPTFGPWVELLLLSIMSLGKRRKDHDTRSFFAKVWEWAMSRFRRPSGLESMPRPPQPPAPTRQTTAPPSRREEERRPEPSRVVLNFGQGDVS